MKKRVTLADVAKVAGVSAATVSLALRDSPQIPEKTKRVLRATAEKCGYVYNQSAASMRGSNETLVGMVMSGSANRFNAEVVSEFSRKCADNGKMMLYGDADEDTRIQAEILKRMIENNVKTVYVCAAVGSTAEDFSIAREHGIRIVQILRNVRELDAPYVGFDNVNAANHLTERLVTDGHKTIAFLGGSPTSSSREERRIGYELALRNNKLPVTDDLEVESEVTRKAGYDGMEQLLALPQRPTAVFCYNDIVAYGAMLKLIATDVAVGHDMAIAGFDDLEESSLWSPALTSVALDKEMLVSKALSILNEESWHAGSVNVVLTPRIQLRASTKNWNKLSSV